MKAALIVAALLCLYAIGMLAQSERHWVRDETFIGLPTCPDENSYYVSETAPDHVKVVCAHYEDGPEPSE